MGKVCVFYDEIVTENPNKIKNGDQKKFMHEFLSGE